MTTTAAGVRTANAGITSGGCTGLSPPCLGSEPSGV